MSQTWLVGLAVITGALVPFQLAFNGQLGQALRSVHTASLFIFLIGTLVLLAIVAANRAPWPSLSTLQAVPLTAWLGGLIAVAYIAAVVFLTPRLGVGSSAILIVAGQLIAALILDHLGAFGMPQTSLNGFRLTGAALVVAGAWLIRSH